MYHNLLSYSVRIATIKILHKLSENVENKRNNLSCKIYLFQILGRLALLFSIDYLSFKNNEYS